MNESYRGVDHVKAIESSTCYIEINAFLKYQKDKKKKGVIRS